MLPYFLIVVLIPLVAGISYYLGGTINQPVPSGPRPFGADAALAAREYLQEAGFNLDRATVAAMAAGAAVQGQPITFVSELETRAELNRRYADDHRATADRLREQAELENIAAENCAWAAANFEAFAALATV